MNTRTNRRFNDLNLIHHYAILGLKSMHASPAEIRQAYKKTILIWHSDKLPESTQCKADSKKPVEWIADSLPAVLLPADHETALEIFHRAQAAYEFLTVGSRYEREQYDSWLNEEMNTPAYPGKPVKYTSEKAFAKRFAYMQQLSACNFDYAKLAKFQFKANAELISRLETAEQEIRLLKTQSIPARPTASFATNSTQTKVGEQPGYQRRQETMFSPKSAKTDEKIRPTGLLNIYKLLEFDCISGQLVGTNISLQFGNESNAARFIAIWNSLKQQTGFEFKFGIHVETKECVYANSCFLESNTLYNWMMGERGDKMLEILRSHFNFDGISIYNHNTFERTVIYKSGMC